MVVRWARVLRPGLWRIPRQIRSEKDEKATGIWARLENMGNFGEQLLKRQEEQGKERGKGSKAGEETELQED